MIRRTLIVLMMTGTVVLFDAGTAFGKGPDSVTISGPGVGRPVELMNADYSDHVKELMQQTGLWYGTNGGRSLPKQPGGALGPSYTLSWINSGPPGDPVEARTIRQTLYLPEDGGPVIHTPAQEGLEGWGPSVIGWFRAPDDLADTLASLGAAPSDAEEDRSVAAGGPERLGSLAAIGSAVVVLMWAIRRRLVMTATEGS